MKSNEEMAISVVENGTDKIGLGNIVAGQMIADSIGKTGDTIATSIKAATAEVSNAIIEGNMLMVSNILSASNVIATELSRIASEMERNVKLQELNSLKDRIYRDEDWLYKHNLLKQFYEHTNIGNKYISNIEPNIEAIPLLSKMCESLDVEYVEKFLPNKENFNCERILQEYCIVHKCAPIPYLIDLVHKNGFIYTKAEYKHSGFSYIGQIRPEDVDIRRVFITGTRCSFKTKEYPYNMEMFNSNSEFYDSYRIKKTNYANPVINYAYTVKFSQEKAKKFIEDKIQYYKDYTINERDRLSWINFYRKLNNEINLDNLRNLEYELELYVRKSKIQQ